MRMNYTYLRIIPEVIQDVAKAITCTSSPRRVANLLHELLLSFKMRLRLLQLLVITKADAQFPMYTCFKKLRSPLQKCVSEHWCVLVRVCERRKWQIV